MNRTILFLLSLTFMASPFTSGVNKPALAESLNTQTSRPILLANSGLPNPSNCPNQLLFTQWKTRNFYVSICGDTTNGETTYIGVPLDGSDGITLPLQSHKNGIYVAGNGNYHYVLTKNRLIVTQNGRVIVDEPAKNIYANGN